MSDLISRKMMKPKTAIRMLKNMETMCIYQDAYGQPVDKDLYEDALDMAIEALQAKTDGDTISRQAAIDAANRADYRGLTVEDVKKVTDEVVKELKRLPSAEPKTGKWIKEVYSDGWNEYTIYTCSECLENYKDLGRIKVKNGHVVLIEPSWCPNCGVKMLGKD